MRGHDDPVDAVILAFLDYCEGAGERPALDHLDDADRSRAETLLRGLVAARGIDPRTARPSVESLLAATPLARLLSTPDWPSADGADLTTVARVLGGVDARVRVAVDDETVVYSYLDLRVRFLLVPAGAPVVTEHVRALVASLFGRDPDTSRVGVVAARSEELTTQILAPDDLGDTITTPRGEPHLRWEPPLPLVLAARRMVEQGAPQWPSFDFDHARGEPLDLAGVAAEIARRVIARESARSYRGEKRRAYQSLVGRERAFADLVTRVSARGSTVDLDRETTRISQAAA